MLFSTFFAVFLSAGRVWAESARPLYVPLGGSVRWSAPARQRIHVSDGRRVRLRDQGSYVEIWGRKLGPAQISVGGQATTVRVVPSEAYREAELLQSRLKGRLGLELTWTGDQPTIIGRLHRFSDWEILARPPHSAEYVFAAELDEDVRLEARDQFAKWIGEDSLPDDAGFFSAGLLRVHGLGAAAQERLRPALKPWGLRLDADADPIEIAPLVRVQIVISELSRSVARQFGVEWSSAYQSRLLPKPAQPGELLVTLKALEQEGHGQILASPNLLSRSGSRAEFLAGGEFPIKIIGFDSRDVVWKRHGILLSILPRVDRGGRMSIELQTEVSTIDPGQTVDGIPGLKTHRIASHFDLKGPGTIILSGLLRQELGEALQGLPLVQSLPVLGPLFGSRNFLEKRTELVVFVSPALATDGPDVPHPPRGWKGFSDGSR